LALGFSACLGGVLVLDACASRAGAVGSGGECYLASDCAPGLVCVEQSNHTRICSDDVSRIAGQAPPDGGGPAMDGGDASARDGSRPDGAQEPPDSGGPQPDTGGPEPDTGGPPPPDAEATD
jgi:hypothetical protein